MPTVHAEAFEYDTIGERAVTMAHQLAARRALTAEALAALGDQAGAAAVAELTETLAHGLAAVTLAMLANGRAVARAADGHVDAPLAGAGVGDSES